MDAKQTRQGVLLALAAYFIWGIAPAYFKFIAYVPADEILTHRVIWSFFFMIALMSLSRQWSGVKTLLQTPKKIFLLALSAVLIGGNWLLTTLQPRFLNVIEANKKLVFVNGDEELIALQLKGGNAVWINDNLIDVNDASLVGTQYGGTGSTSLTINHGDCNFDNKVNVQDLALVGGNFDLTSETAYGITNAYIWTVQAP